MCMHVKRKKFRIGKRQRQKHTDTVASWLKYLKIPLGSKVR